MGITGFQKTRCFSTFVFSRIIAIYLEEITYKIRYTTPVRLRLSIWVVYYCTRTFRQFFIVAGFFKTRFTASADAMFAVPAIATFRLTTFAVATYLAYCPVAAFLLVAADSAVIITALAVTASLGCTTANVTATIITTCGVIFTAVATIATGVITTGLSGTTANAIATYMGPASVFAPAVLALIAMRNVAPDWII